MKYPGILSRAVAGMLPLLAIQACNMNSEYQPNTAASPLGSGFSRVEGSVQDSTGRPISAARVYLYREGNDSVADTTVRTFEDGSFLVDVAPGRFRIFTEKDGRVARSTDFKSFEANATTQLNSIRLAKVLEGSFTIPGVQNASFSVRLEGSPLDVSVSSKGVVTFNVVEGSESFLMVAFTNKAGITQTHRFRIQCLSGGFSISPIIPPLDSIVTPKSPMDTATPRPPAATPSLSDTFEIHPDPDQVADCPFIGSLQGGSSWENTNFGSRQEEGLGGAWDDNTVGRLLWKYDISKAIPPGRKLRSVRLVWTPIRWGLRPNGGQDLTILAHRMLVDWKEGHGAGQDGEAASSTNDGATAAGPMFGKTWSEPFLGLNGVDAESVPIDSQTLSYKSLEKMSFDITTAAKGWLADPNANHGILLRSSHENDVRYLDYPVFASDDYTADTTMRPYLVVVLEPEESIVPPDTGSRLLVLQPGPEGQDDACVIGTFTGNGSHDGNTQGTDPLQSLGGSWDYNTIGRLLWKMVLPDSLKNRKILSARAVFKVNRWLDRPLGGHDYRVEAYKMLRPWKEGAGTFPGQPNSSTLDGVTSLGPRHGEFWHSTLVGLDGVDAEKTRSSYAVLPWNDTSFISFEMTDLVKEWLANPEANHGVIFRSLEELDPSFPNFPGFDMSEVSAPERRPKMVIEYE